MSLNRRFEIIDILRGLAALAVVVFHVRVDLWVGWREIQAHPEAFSVWDRLAAWLSLPAPVLGHAVMLFFVVSGFCVHLPYATGAFRLLPYTIRRFTRIYPPYLAAVILTLGVELLLAEYFATPATSVGKYLQTIFMVQNYPPREGQLISNPALWSLPVEMEFYILYPLLLVFGRKMGSAGWLLVSGSFSAVGAGIDLIYGQSWLLGNFAEYWLLWCSGAWLADQVSAGKLAPWSHWKTLLSGLLLAAGVWSTFRNHPIVIQHFIWGAFYFMLVLWCLAAAPFQNQSHTKVWSWLVKLGAVSYSLYLVHSPLFRLLGAMWVSGFGGKPANFLISLLFCIAMIPVAWLFYVLFERSSHALARRWRKK